MPAHQVSSEGFEKKVLKSKAPVVVDFYAPWCGPCKMAAPVFDKLADEFSGKVKIFKVNVDESQDLAQKYGVMSIPTVIVFVNGEEANRQMGFVGEEGYRKMIEDKLKT